MVLTCANMVCMKLQLPDTLQYFRSRGRVSSISTTWKHLQFWCNHLQSPGSHEKRLPSHQQPWPMSVTNALPRIIPEDDPEQMNAASHGKLSFDQEELTNSKVAVVNRESPSQIQSAGYKRTRNQYCIICPSVGIRVIS